MSQIVQSVICLVTLGFVTAVIAVASDLVEIDGEFNSSRFANIEAKQLQILWNSEYHFMPTGADDFLASGRRGLWRSGLDGPAHANAQTLLVFWDASPDKVSFRLNFQFGSNHTHWFLSQIRIHTSLFSATALWLPSRSGDHRLLGAGHSIAALKGKPFECHYLELPFIVDDLQSKSLDRRERTAGEPARIELGDTAGVLVMDDFLISGWEESISMRPTNRLNVEPCGLQLCGIQAMNDLVTSLELRQLGQKAELEAAEGGHGPWRKRFGQAHSYLRSLERVCGTERDIGVMRSSHSSSDSLNIMALPMTGLASLVAIWGSNTL